MSTGVFLGKMCSYRRKNHGCGQKKPEGTSSVRFGLRTAANNAVNSSGEPTSSQENQLNWTDNLRRVLEGKFVFWFFRLPPKRRLSIVLNFFFPLIKLFWTFVIFAKTQITIRSRAKNVGYSIGLSQVCATSYWWSCGADGRTYVLTVTWLYVTTKISWLDRLPDLLSNGALLSRYARGLC